MTYVRPILALLAAQLAGEVLVRLLALPVPGPVLGMALMLPAFHFAPALHEAVRPPAEGLLRHLSLLFVPAGVGIVGHLDRLGREGPALLLAVVLSTALAIPAGALAFRIAARLSERRP